MTLYRYFVKVASKDISRFETYLKDQDIKASILSFDWGLTGDGLTNLYSIKMSEEDAMSLKLRFPLTGFMNFVNTLNRLRPRLDKNKNAC
jgi:hypothetical protein